MLCNESETFAEELERLDALPPCSDLDINESLIAEVEARYDEIIDLSVNKNWPISAIAPELNIDITPDTLSICVLKLRSKRSVASQDELAQMLLKKLIKVLQSLVD